jgi:uncharacterized repeat protein (TIGR03803 family)
MNRTLACARRAIPVFPRLGFIAGALVALTLLTLNIGAAAQTEKVLYSFNGTTGAVPFGLVADTSGNLYGESSATTAQEWGSIYRLAKGPSGHWNLTVLYVFKGLRDGKGPNEKLVVDSAGNLYGTTFKGGIGDCSCGTVFELSPTASGPWKETTLYSFQGGNDGAVPLAGLTSDSAGNLYGTTSVGGQADLGTVFELSPTSGGVWSKSTLYSFQGGSDGLNPSDPVALDQSDNIYGVTEIGGGLGSCDGTYGCGTVFELTSNSGSWSESILYTFTGSGDGGVPTGGVAIDRYGDLYGVTNRGGYLSLCGGIGCGTVFTLEPYFGSWVFGTIYIFQDLTDGAYPYGGLAASQTADVVYGTTTIGGSSGYGTVFKLVATQAGFLESTLHDFAGGTDGASPYGNLILDAQGDLYGATTRGGADNQGTIFKIFP